MVRKRGWRRASLDRIESSTRQLSKSQLAALQRVWDDLTARSNRGAVPVSDEQVGVEVLDSWLAGVASSKGRLEQSSVDDLLDTMRELPDSGEVQLLVDRVLAIVGTD